MINGTSFLFLDYLKFKKFFKLKSSLDFSVHSISSLNMSALNITFYTFLNITKLKNFIVTVDRELFYPQYGLFHAPYLSRIAFNSIKYGDYH